MLLQKSINIDMIINNTHKFIFLKTHKTASTSIENYFSQYNTQDDNEFTYNILMQIKTKYGPTETARYHAAAEDIINVIGIEEWNKYSKITTVRNPYEKMISAYFFLSEYLGTTLKTPIEEQIRFNHWITLQDDPYFWEMCDSYTYRLDGNICVDHIIRVEHLNSDLEVVCQKLNLPFEIDNIKKINATSRPQWATCEFMYSEKSKKVIDELFAFELEYFEYKYTL